ncbi:MAG: hypothetical protein JXR95_13885 [Deltaproteobacteria bacterium]|nr:hypothetical protein [Deltaproteobacteria bacterium]
MKKLFAILAVALLAMSFAACKKDKGEETTPSTDNAPADTKPADDAKPADTTPAPTKDATPAATTEAPKAEEKPATK